MLNNDVSGKFVVLLKLKVIFILLLIGVFYTNFVFDNLPLSYSLDSEIIEDMVLFDNNEFKLFSSYGNVALLYESLPRIFLTSWANTFIVFICLAILVTKTKYISTLTLILTLSGLCYVYMGRVSKDIVIFVILTIFYLFQNNTPKVKYLTLGAMYLFYGLIFRHYFLLIYCLFLILPNFLRKPLIFSLSLSIILIVLPSSIYEFIYQSKMEINLFRLYESDVRTIILNPSDQMNFFGFLINYIYSLVVINFPVFFGLKFQDLIVIVMNFVIWFSIHTHIKKNRLQSHDFSYEYLLLSHLLVMYIFEPDIGSYFRHLLAFTPLIVIVIENQKVLKTFANKLKKIKLT